MSQEQDTAAVIIALNSEKKQLKEKETEKKKNLS